MKTFNRQSSAIRSRSRSKVHVNTTNLNKLLSMYAKGRPIVSKKTKKSKSKSIKRR